MSDGYSPQFFVKKSVVARAFTLDKNKLINKKFQINLINITHLLNFCRAYHILSFLARFSLKLFSKADKALGTYPKQCSPYFLKRCEYCFYLFFNFLHTFFCSPFKSRTTKIKSFYSNNILEVSLLGNQHI